MLRKREGETETDRQMDRQKDGERKRKGAIRGGWGTD